MLLIFYEICKFCLIFAEFLLNFDHFFSGFSQKLMQHFSENKPLAALHGAASKGLE